MTDSSEVHLQYEVPYADTDRMGIIYYANYLVFFERTRTRLLASLGYPYPDMERDGIGLPVIEAYVKYKAPATYGDILDFYGRLDSYTPTRLKVVCVIRRQETLLAFGHTLHACLNLKTGRPVRFPPKLTAVLQAYTPAAAADISRNSS